ncbi:MAG: flagellar M-ring protein FliF, partial [Parvularculaceae bacterium]|nr:flagellar M-ring protein FliF [Parvularculaceae bacterium]
MNEILGMIRSFGIARLGAIIGVTLGVAVAMALIVTRVAQEPMTLLYADLDLKDGQDLATRLDQDGVKYEVRETRGTVSIYAPRDKAADLKLKLAGDGFVVRSKSVGYEIFD